MENKQLPADVQEPKWKLILHDGVEDPYYELTNGPISLCAPCGFVGETEEGEDAIFKCVADALNHSGIDFHSENKLELEQHIKIMELQYEVDYLKDHIEAQPRIGWVKGDYDRLYDQLKANPEKRIVCYVDYDGFSRRDGSVPCRDICTVRGTQTEFLARGIGYGGAPSWYDEEHRKEEFLQECDRLNVEWLDESASPAAGREEDATDYQQLKSELEEEKRQRELSVKSLRYALEQRDQQLSELKARAEKMEKALEIIANWQLPSTGRYWDHGTNLEPMSYEAAYGSNGVRDYMKNVAAEALSGEEEAPNG